MRIQPLPIQHFQIQLWAVGVSYHTARFDLAVSLQRLGRVRNKHATLTRHSGTRGCMLVLSMLIIFAACVCVCVCVCVRVCVATLQVKGERGPLSARPERLRCWFRAFNAPVVPGQGRDRVNIFICYFPCISFWEMNLILGNHCAPSCPCVLALGGVQRDAFCVQRVGPCARVCAGVLPRRVCVPR